MLKDAKYRVITTITAKNSDRLLFHLGSSIQKLNFEVAERDMTELRAILGSAYETREIREGYFNLNYLEIMVTSPGKDNKQVTNGCYITRLAEVDKYTNSYLVKISKGSQFREVTCAIWMYDACDEVVYFEPDFETTEIIVQTFPDSRLVRGS